MAFETVCPDRIDMIHKNYRKLCNLLVDVDEWGQVMILNMLTRYTRTQFVDPNHTEVGECTFKQELCYLFVSSSSSNNTEIETKFLCLCVYSVCSYSIPVAQVSIRQLVCI